MLGLSLEAGARSSGGSEDEALVLKRSACQTYVEISFVGIEAPEGHDRDNRLANAIYVGSFATIIVSREEPLMRRRATRTRLPIR